jgi:hypothetical protein
VNFEVPCTSHYSIGTIDSLRFSIGRSHTQHREAPAVKCQASPFDTPLLQPARLAIPFSCTVRQSAMIPKSPPCPKAVLADHRQCQIGCEKIMLMGIQPVFYNGCCFCGWLVAEQGLMLSPGIKSTRRHHIETRRKNVLFHIYKSPIPMTLHFRCHRTFLATPDVRRQKRKLNGTRNSST